LGLFGPPENGPPPTRHEKDTVCTTVLSEVFGIVLWGNKACSAECRGEPQAQGLFIQWRVKCETGLVGFALKQSRCFVKRVVFGPVWERPACFTVCSENGPSRAKIEKPNPNRFTHRNTNELHVKRLRTKQNKTTPRAAPSDNSTRKRRTNKQTPRFPLAEPLPQPPWCRDM
jgi:hypothetical protein